MHAYIHTNLTYRHTHIIEGMQIYMHTCIHTLMHTYIITRVHAIMVEYTHISI